MRQAGSLSAAGTVSEARRAPLRALIAFNGGPGACYLTLLVRATWPPKRKQVFWVKKADFMPILLSKYGEKADNTNEGLGKKPETQECS